jgi:thymidylate synthase (FAD)
MQFVEPKVFHIAQTSLDTEGVGHFLQELGVPDWDTDAPSDQEKLIEFGGKLCYLSFAPQILNKNVTKITEDNKKYIGNILKQKHGSVLEHGCDSFALLNVSRIFTHELVRHRVGTAFSQVSGRYVRIESIDNWFPEIFSTHEEVGLIKSIYTETLINIECGIKKLLDILKLDEIKSFDVKKKLTSAIRRLAPNGMANHILVTANHRAWRHMIEMRTSRHAEEEIRLVFGMIFYQLVTKYPNLYQDYTAEKVDGFFEIKFENSKV